MGRWGGGGQEEVLEGGGIYGDDGDLTWGGEHTMQSTGDVLWNCAPETCIILLTSVTPSTFHKKEKKNLGLCHPQPKDP